MIVIVSSLFEDSHEAAHRKHILVNKKLETSSSETKYKKQNDSDKIRVRAPIKVSIRMSKALSPSDLSSYSGKPEKGG